eukprot:TRINITY_DN55026_c0_g1_i1.p4 TRINITY_DN55026_c0_g1~~TRINITY_DN55026_c0_g1_i1.p4  ORF type:complete len:105 (+),score=5.72 TRINITY_DN55026_c0_g1_i1:590-904(+)
MHPLLTVDKHPSCAELIRKLQQCHADHPIAKFWNVCADVKTELDACFRQEKVVKRTANLRASKEFQERLRQTKAAEDAAGVPRWTEVLRKREGEGAHGSAHADV